MFIKRDAFSTELSTGIPQKRNVFFIFVHFGDPKVTDAAIASAIREGQRADRIIVVDHGGSPYKTAHAVSIVRTKTNKGYAEGLREGMLHVGSLKPSSYDIVVLANNDVVLEKGARRRIIAWWEKNGSNRTLAGASWGYVSLVSGRSHVARNITRRPSWNIPYIHGSCIVMEYEFAQNIAWPTELYMYWEDVVLSMAAVRNGASLRVISGLPVAHNDAVASPSPQKAYYLVRNGAYVLESFASWPWRTYWFLVNSLRWTYHRILPKHRHIAQALRDARMQRLGKMSV